MVRAGYLFNSTIAGIENADACLLIGTNPRREAAMINARLRKRFLHGGFRVGAIGPAFQSTFPVDMLGAGGDALNAIAGGDHPWVETLRNAKAPMIVVGSGALTRADGAQVLGAARRIAERCGIVRPDWNGFNVLHRAASRVAGLDLGLVPQRGGRDLTGILAGCRSGEIEVLYLLGADEVEIGDTGSTFVVYQGHHGDRGAARADVVLPGAAYTEKDGTYVNTEGRVQLAHRAVYPPGEAREDWAILRAISAALRAPLPFDSLYDLRRHMHEVAPHLAKIDELVPPAWGPFGADGPVASEPFVYPINDFYRTDPISRASVTMAHCSELFTGNGHAALRTGTHG
jgi:NADH-quinone oxidoreductase subunit G